MKKQGNPNTRLEAFSDGIFSIAITLLILDVILTIPEEKSITSHELLISIKNTWPAWLALILSFGTILNAWSNHNHAFNLIDQSSKWFNLTNGFFLFTIVLIPYSTKLLAEFLITGAEGASVMFYSFTLGLKDLARVILYNSMYPLTLDQKNRSNILTFRKASIVGFIIYLIIGTISYYNPNLAIIIIILVWLIWFFAGKNILEKAANKLALKK